ncbi:unnamed protein product [Meloidogyne enterolobii]|uniref:Uncharacterized protein n=1 Tax=Meloidogyne enterolobii TaxID=390850 RepID=A0ACB0XLF7_MELEN
MATSSSSLLLLSSQQQNINYFKIKKKIIFPKYFILRLLKIILRFLSFSKYFLFYSFNISFVFSVNNNQPKMNCDLEKAEACFTQLFEQLPICLDKKHNGEIAFRCHHFNVLDICFGDNQIRCLPAAIGTAARIAYQKRVDGCLLAAKIDEGKPIEEQKTGPGRQAAGLLASPSELQFISLFGYLQTQCRPRRRIQNEGGNERSGNRRSHFRSEQLNNHYIIANCSDSYIDEIIGDCETEMKKRQPSPYMELERHKLLRLKLDISSKLLQFPETRPEDECMMVRSVFSDIFLIHQRFCFHTTVTRCLCERYQFERTCGIQCANLEAYGLPLNRKLLWTDFRGFLSGSENIKRKKVEILIFLFISFYLWIFCIIN